MAENSGISWTDHTYNPWIGCTKVGPGCDNCYAETLATRRLGVGWGDDAPRRRTKTTYKDVLRWQKSAPAFFAAKGHWPRVFAASLADIFDKLVDPSWRSEFWALVRQCDRLQWLIVTKRIPNVEKMLPGDWSEENYGHVVLIVTVVNQAEADRDVPRLVALKSRYPWLKIGLSVEPMLGAMDLSEWLLALDWVITGGESQQGAGMRSVVPLRAEWVRDIARQCAAAGVPHHFKQWGATIPEDQFCVEMREVDERIAWTDDPAEPAIQRARFKDWMGRELDGVEHNGFPPALEVGI